MRPEVEDPYNTWGISGPVFLVGYAVLLLLTYGVMWWAQRRIWRTSSPSRIDLETLDPCDIGLLTSKELAITVAFLELERRGAVALDAPLADHLTAEGYKPGTWSSRHLKSAASEAPAAARIEWVPPHEPRCRTEQAIVQAFLGLEATRPGERYSPTDVAMRAKDLLGPAEEALEQRGLKPSSQLIGRLRRTLIWSIPVVVLGIVRLLYGLSRAKPVSFLATVLIGIAVYLAYRWPASAWTPPAMREARRRWNRGQRSRDRHRVQRQETSPDDVTPLPIDVAAAGTRALWAVAPGLALSLGAPGPASSAGGGGGGGCGGGGGGCGG